MIKWIYLKIVFKHLKYYIYITILIYIKLKRSNKLWLGILTFSPLVFLTIFIIWFVSIFINNIYILENSAGQPPIEIFRLMMTAFIFLALAIIVKLGLMIYYIIHVSDNQDNDNNKKILWILIFVFVGTIGNIIYFFMEIVPSSNTNHLNTKNSE
jgi:phospholipase D-like protein